MEGVVQVLEVVHLVFVVVFLDGVVQDHLFVTLAQAVNLVMVIVPVQKMKINVDQDMAAVLMVNAVVNMVGVELLTTIVKLKKVANRPMVFVMGLLIIVIRISVV